MMKILIFILSAIMSLIIGPYPPEVEFEYNTIEVNGITYKNGFVSDEYLSLNVDSNSFNYNKDNPVLKEYVFNLSGGRYETYYNYGFGTDWIWHGESTSTSYSVRSHLYCPEEKWATLNEFYSDSDNYNYYVKLCESPKENVYYSENTLRFDIVEPDSVKIDKLYSFVNENEYSLTSGSDTITISDEVYYTLPEFAVFKESKDGLFKSNVGRFHIYNNKPYLFDVLIGQQHTVDLLTLPDELSDYIITVFKNNGAEKYFVS